MSRLLRERGALLAGSAAFLACLALALPGHAAATVQSGALSALASPNECVGQTEEQNKEPNALCGTAVPFGLNHVYEAQVSPDGSNVYSVSINGDLIEYARNQATGALSVIGCITASSEECAEAGSGAVEQKNIALLAEPTAIAISPNGEDVYVTADGSDAVVELKREGGTGLLSIMEAGHACVSGNATGECEHLNAKGISGPYGIAISPNGETVYVADVGGQSVAELARNETSGLLEPIPSHECIGGPGSGCPDETKQALTEPIGVVVSPDNENVYVAAGASSKEGEIASFKREADGALTQMRGPEGCISAEITHECTTGIAVDGSEDLVVSPDGSNVYATSFADSAVVEFEREPSSGALTQLSGGNACITNETISECTTVKSIGGPRGLSISPDGEDLYVGSTSQASVAAFKRESSAKGALVPFESPYECITTEPTGCGTHGLKGLEGARRLVVSPDGTNVYVAAQEGHSIVELARAVTPAVSGVSPPYGSEAGGSQVNVEGSGFIAGASVEFGGTPAAEVTVNSASSITAEAPPGSGTVDVKVTTANGTSKTGEADHFKYVYVPPHLLGGLNLNGYCQSLGYTSVTLHKGELVGEDAAFENWACVEKGGHEVLIAATGPAPSMDNACAVQHPDSFAYAEEPNDAYSWNCFEEQPSGKGSGSGGGGNGNAKAASVPPPTLAKTGNVAPVSGTVLVELPGAKSFVSLTTLTQIPLGSVIDATNGHVSVTVAQPGGGTETGEFFDGEFVLTQEANGMTVATLTGGNFAVCPRRYKIPPQATTAIISSASGRHVVRKLWANAHGKFTTKGNYAAGAVQGTEWLTEDLCEGTLIRVTRDKVAVTNLATHKHVEVRTGHHYLAKAPLRKARRRG
ncbi:MAG: IPT/TIG domain-containing protein [Solirubrobacteraceae bacterium]